MESKITKDKLQQLLKQGLSQSEIARRTGIPRSTLRKRIKALGTPTVYQGTQTPEALTDTGDELQEMLEWWRVVWCTV